ncbi:Hypothetical predicted protein [Pelobates cultripes]|uniref:Uncharacterized protein n=1 Tax=Pelobates cultripes TaxID=61616 RepID=A0AAD1WVC7_PELCU|nr:Hypothetical predicted protein [Pelobates cultripes]
MINKQKSKSYIAQLQDHQGQWPIHTTKICTRRGQIGTTLNQTAGQKPSSPYLEANIHTKLTEDAKRTLEAPLSIEELANGVKATKPGKSPGPDGLTIAIIKNLQASYTHNS